MNLKLIASIVISLLIILSVVVISFNHDEDIEIDGLKIDSKSFNDLSNIVPDNHSYNLCSISQNKCVKVVKIKDG